MICFSCLHFLFYLSKSNCSSKVRLFKTKFYNFCKKSEKMLLFLHTWLEVLETGVQLFHHHSKCSLLSTGKHGNKIRLDDSTRLFLYQLVGTWGQLLFPKPWKEFRLWYDEHKAKGIKPILDGMVFMIIDFMW